LAGFKAFIWSNLCTRHIPEKLTPRGHHDWPDKRATRKEAAFLPTGGTPNSVQNFTPNNLQSDRANLSFQNYLAYPSTLFAKLGLLDG
jgi:hypothetical protein